MNNNALVITQIKQILNGSHKTYKYILVNGVLAKSCLDEINPIALQAGAPFPGAFDARSLCHKVLVPFERDFLDKVLGGSNEPFLNKPARFTHLSPDNAVRAGKDKAALLLLIEILSTIKTSMQAKEYLACILMLLQIQQERKIKEFKAIHYHPSIIDIYNFSMQFIQRSFQGETLTLLVATLEQLFYTSLPEHYTVMAHPVNQSGSSSQQVGDIDVYFNGKIYYSIEVKDKNFNQYDVEHAFNKMLQSSVKKAAFVYGMNAKFDASQVSNTIETFEKRGLFCIYQDIQTHIRNTLIRWPSCTKQHFAQTLMSTAEAIHCTRDTQQWMQQLFSTLNWDIED